MDAILVGHPRLARAEGVVPFPERGEVKHLFDGGDEAQEEYKHIWLFHAQSGLCGLLVRKAVVQVNKRDVKRLVILQHGDEVQIGPALWTYEDIFSGEVVGGAESSLAACSYCTSPLEGGQVFVRCPLCFAIYHDDCWVSIERKRCCTRGCRFLPNKIEVSP